jgi:hypothetical protein
MARDNDVGRIGRAVRLDRDLVARRELRQRSDRHLGVLFHARFARVMSDTTVAEIDPVMAVHGKPYSATNANQMIGSHDGLSMGELEPESRGCVPAASQRTIDERGVSQ